MPKKPFRGPYRAFLWPSKESWKFIMFLNSVACKSSNKRPNNRYNLFGHFETMVTSNMVQCKVALDPSNIMLEIATLPTKICSLIQNIPRTYLFLKHIQINKTVHTKKIIMVVMKHLLPNI